MAAATLAATRLGADALLRRRPSRGRADPEAGRWRWTWTVALDVLAADDPAALALLSLLAWLGPEPVPLSLLGGHPAGAARTARRPSAARPGSPSGWTCCAVAAWPRSPERTVRLPRWAVRSDGRPQPADRPERSAAGGWPAAAVRLLRAALPDEPSHDPATWPSWRRLLPLVLTATDPARPLDPVATDVGWLLGRAGNYLHARGQPAAARSLFEDAYELCFRWLGPDHPDTAAAAARLVGDPSGP